jgi:hypothetical protein
MKSRGCNNVCCKGYRSPRGAVVDERVAMVITREQLDEYEKQRFSVANLI